jgi:hypothetical protein
MAGYILALMTLEMASDQPIFHVVKRERERFLFTASVVDLYCVSASR